MSLYDNVRNLPLDIEGYRLEPLEREVARGFTLKRTVVVLYGGGEEGRGEEVDYDPRAQEQFQADEGTVEFTLDDHVDGTRLVVVESSPAWSTALELQASAFALV